MPATVTAAEIAAAIRNVPDFPKPGIQFKDITPVLADARLFAGAIELLTKNFAPGSVDAVVGIDARGFIFAAAAATKLKAGFIPVRKKGKLPFTTIEQDYALEYGHATVALHTDAIKPGETAVKTRAQKTKERRRPACVMARAASTSPLRGSRRRTVQSTARLGATGARKSQQAASLRHGQDQQ